MWHMLSKYLWGCGVFKPAGRVAGTPKVVAEVVSSGLYHVFESRRVHSLGV